MLLDRPRELIKILPFCYKELELTL